MVPLKSSAMQLNRTGSKMPTIRDVAEMAGVSKATVSLAFNHPDRVNAETVKRVRQAAKAVGYAANPLAQTLARGSSRVIAMVVVDISVPFFSKVLRELEKAAEQNGYVVLVADSGASVEREDALLRYFAGQRVAGIALSPTSATIEYGSSLSSLDIPLVCFDNKVLDMDVDFVGTDNELATAMLAEHLVQLGHRRIAFIGGSPELYSAQMRERGFRSVMDGRNIPIDPALLFDGAYSAERAYQACMRMLTGRDRPSAIIVANNVMGMAAMQAIRELGIDCPSEVSIAMVDETPWSNLMIPRPTAVVQDTARIGATVSRFLFERILTPENRNMSARTELVPTLFAEGGSCQKITEKM